MHNVSRRVLVAALWTVGAACASNQQSESADVAELAPRPFPRLISCPVDVGARESSDAPPVRLHVRVLVGVDGRVLQVAPSNDPNHTEYQSEASGLARMCLFRPAIQDGEAVAAWHGVVVQLRSR